MADKTKTIKETEKGVEDKAAVIRPDNGDPEAGKTYITTYGGTTIKTRW